MASSKSRPHGSAEPQRTVPHTRLDDESQFRAEYEFGKKLGQGSFGVVHEATRLRDNEKWAVKIISKDIKEKDRSTAFKLLEREVAILKQVQHEHIIHLEEVLETPKKMYLIMEVCEGGELADNLKVKKKYSEADTKVIISKLARAIQYMHKRDIVHRDLKLENILLTHNPEDPDDHLHIKVTDFGLSVVKDGVGCDSMMQAVCGTPVYMSPEIIHNKTYSQQCDVWAMGIIMYTLLCGYPPFVGDDEDKLYETIKRGHINFPDSSFKHISEEAKNCICGMLKVDPAHRYTASEVLEHSWISGKEMKPGPTNVLEMMKEWNNLNLDSENLDSCAIDNDLTKLVGGTGNIRNGNGNCQDEVRNGLSNNNNNGGLSSHDLNKPASSIQNNNHKVAPSSGPRSLGTPYRMPPSSTRPASKKAGASHQGASPQIARKPNSATTSKPSNSPASSRSRKK